MKLVRVLAVLMIAACARTPATHTVRHYLGCRGFHGEDELLAFEDRIDALAGVEPWKKSDERLDRRRQLVWRIDGICEQLRALTAHVASIPKQDGIPFVEQAPDELRSFENDQIFTRDAKSIRVETVPVRLWGTLYPWPVEDLVPAAQLTTRTFTPDEWHALRLRLLAGKQDGVLNGKQFGLNTPVLLRVIATR